MYQPTLRSFWLIAALSAVSTLSLACSPPSKDSHAEHNAPPPTAKAPMPAGHNHMMMVHSEQDFLRQMLPHHQEAIDTSKWLLAATQSSELKQFADKVISAQSAEIAQMHTWHQAWYKSPLSAADYMAMMPMNASSPYEGKKSDAAYMQGMIAHHQGAIDMAKQVLALSPRPEVQQMANNIIASQSQEVAQLTAWIKATQP